LHYFESKFLSSISDNYNFRNTRPLLKKRKSGWWSCLIWAKTDFRKWVFLWVQGWGFFRKQGSRCARIRFT